MAQYEIERKWILYEGQHFIHPHLQFIGDTYAHQWYLIATDNSQLRVTKKQSTHGDRYTLNIKQGNGLKRHEAKIEITYKEFLTLVNQLDPKTVPILKHTYGYRLSSGHVLDIALVDDDWWYAEVEFDSEEEALKFDIIPYFDKEVNIREVTGDPFFMMKNYWRRTRLGEEDFPWQ